MSVSKHVLLAGISALALITVPASARSGQSLDTGGSSLIGPYAAQLWGAHKGSTPTTCYPGTSAISNPPNPTASSSLHDAVQLWDKTSQKTVACSPATDTPANAIDTFHYLISNSTGGIKGFFSRDKAQLGTVPSGFVDLGNPFFGFSDAALTNGTAGDSDIEVYNNGGTDAAFNTISFRTDNTASNVSPYMKPAARWGALIQLPFSIDPVAVSYNASGLNIATSDSKLHLDKSAYCKIFNHIITDWQNAELTALNNGTPLVSSSTPIQLVGRSDGSGTTSILTRHLANVCSGVTGNKFFLSTNGGADGGFKTYTNLPEGLKSYYVNSTKGIVLNGSSGGVADAIHANAGTIGYIGADYALPASVAVGSTPNGNPAAALLNSHTSTYVDPTAADAIAAYATATPPSGSARSNPENWAPFVTDPTAGYPIVGTTNIVLGTVYSADRVSALVNDGSGSDPEGFLHWYYRANNSVPNAILEPAALGVLPSNWLQAINDTFITNTSGLNLNIHN
ncbi:ABC-type phosphate transport system substrate-binding protein [Rhizomicrobium palustre]|uniref:ABC-type phosphate transport system substrate-binding protein n=1 Tax=Rhizomicrobium palustre TaxID=189966 RepID=A0A846N0E6_9PROT|nr:substrate-binding domain-containing protein [Rhizomicrobium palustre]NIK88969.1 ABC-type phosphate transport system substrate-binding protein [Rhizomicrobium palustre]